MYSLTIAVFGAVVLCATYGATDSSPAEIKEYVFFDFITAENSNDVKERFQNVTVVQKFKLYGHQRFLILVENDKSDHLKQLRLPGDARDVKVVPVETFPEFLSHLGIPWDHRDDDAVYKPLSDGNLTYSERTWITNENFEGMEARMRNGLRGLVRGHTVVFVQAGAMPIKFFLLLPFGDYEVMAAHLMYSRLFGGISVLPSVSYKVHNI